MDVRALDSLSDEARRAIVDRDAGIGAIRADARDIVEEVRTVGDAALREAAHEFDGVELDVIDITDRAAAAADRIDPAVEEAIDAACENVRSFHERQVRDDWRVTEDGVEVGRRFRPVERAGAYVPGGAAAYPSSAIMTVVPARVAGVEHVAVTTPPEPADATLAAAHAAGADAIYAAGGAQGIAALAYGTETVTPVDVVVGPGNRWVTAAKSIVRNDVGIDFLAGPSELLVVADGTADADLVAADLVAQAEHDERASVVAVVTDAETADEIAAACDRQAADRDRTDTIRAALDSGTSGVFTAGSLDEAVAFAEAYAAEHLSIRTADDEAVLDRIDSAGSAFLGPATPVAAGDYATGTNHVLPTGGAARRTGGLSVDTFLRATTVQRLDRNGLSGLRGTIETLAAAEGLEAHAESVRARFDDVEGSEPLAGPGDGVDPDQSEG
jgi:histidinol dehydrogenase